jgi:hypothetical protein
VPGARDLPDGREAVGVLRGTLDAVWRQVFDPASLRHRLASGRGGHATGYDDGALDGYATRVDFRGPR